MCKYCYCENCKANLYEPSCKEKMDYEYKKSVVSHQGYFFCTNTCMEVHKKGIMDDDGKKYETHEKEDDLLIF